jgi:hypothetical protein
MSASAQSRGCVHVDRARVRRDIGLRLRGRALSARTLGCVGADAPYSAQTRPVRVDAARARGDTSVLPPGNFIMEAQCVQVTDDLATLVRSSVRPSVIIHVTTLPPLSRVWGHLLLPKACKGALQKGAKSTFYGAA